MNVSTLKVLGQGLIVGAAVFALTAQSFAGSGPDTAAGPAGTGANVGADNKKQSEAKAHLVYLAGELTTIGRKQKDALAMIQAARLLNQAGGVETPRQRQAEGGEGPTDKPGTATTAQSLLAEARGFAQGNAHVLAIIDMVASSVVATRGSFGGPKATSTVVRAKGRDRFLPVSFYGGELAEVGIVGDRDTDLDLYVYDQHGNVICQRTSAYDTEYCSWYPKWTGPFTIEVRNYGRVANRYVLLTN